MKARVTKWGNSLGLRLPKAVSTQLGIEEDGQVEMEVVQGKLIIRPVLSEDFSLDALVEQITPENCHRETDWGGAVGAEFA
jgi:antitoxin MazE